MLPHFGYKPVSIEETIAAGNKDQSSVFVMMESQEAVDNVNEIAAVEGVDVIMVGTNDLSIELGVPGQWDSPVFLRAIEAISTAARRHGKKLAVAGIYDSPHFTNKCIHSYGARWILVQHDFSMMSRFMSASVKDILALENEPLSNGTK